MAVDIREAVAQAAAEESARRDLLAFAGRVYPGFETPPHLRYIAGLLERLESGDIRRLAISLPVRHGKSVLGSQVFPAWFVGRTPHAHVILASHAESLAVMHSRIAKRIVEDEEAWPFGDVRMASDSASVQRWNTTAGGGLYAVGVGGAITGRGADLLIVDDALHDGLSATEREAAWKWFTEVAVPRLNGGGRILVINARFASDDLIGRIEDAEDSDSWTLVRLPAIAEENDPLDRSPGEPLWPSRMSLSELNERRVLMGSSAFESQFQQNPLPVGGLLFRSEWLGHTYTAIPETMTVAAPSYRQQVRDRLSLYRYGAAASETTPTTLPIVRLQVVDAAAKTGLANDRTAIATIATDLRDFFIEDVSLGRVDYPGLKNAVTDSYARFRPRAVYVEEASNGIALIADLRNSTGIPVIAVKPVDSKLARVEMVSALFESGRVKFPTSAPWLADVISEFTRFPNGKHDDAVDAIVWGLILAQQTIARLIADRQHDQQVDRLRRGGFMSR